MEIIDIELYFTERTQFFFKVKAEKFQKFAKNSNFTQHIP